MKFRMIVVSVLMLSISLLSAMESPYASGPEQEEYMELVPKPRKRLAQKENVARYKKHKPKHAPVEKTKDIIMPIGVYDPVTETVHEQTQAYPLDLQKREHFTQRTFETLINVRAHEGLPFVVAQVTTKENGVEHKDYFDAYRLIGSIFSHDPDMLHPSNPRARNFINPINNLPSVGDIEFFFIPDMHARAFTYLCSDHELYEDKNKRPSMLTFFEENDPRRHGMKEEEKNRALRKTAHDFKQGKFLLAQGKAEQAITSFKKVVEVDNPHYESAALELGNIYFQQKDYDEAMRYLELVAKQNSEKKFVANYLLGMACMMKKDYAAARPYLMISVEDPDLTRKAKSQIMLGESYMEQGKYSDALIHLFAASTSLDLHQRFEGLLQMGILYYKQQKYALAKNYFNIVLRGGIGVGFEQQKEAKKYIESITILEHEHTTQPAASESEKWLDVLNI